MNNSQHLSARVIRGIAPDSPSTLNPSAPDELKIARRHSLVGFDPLLEANSATQSAPFESSTAPSSPCRSTNAPLAQVAAPVKRSSHEPSNSDMAFSAMEEDEERTDMRTSCPGRPLRVDESETRSPPSRKYDTKNKTISPTNEASPQSPYRRATGRRIEFFKLGIPMRKERAHSPSTPQESHTDLSKTKKTPKEPISASGIIRKLPWSRLKGEQKRPHSALETSGEESQCASPNEASEVKLETKTSMYNSIVKDLMELSLENLMLPTLAKPSPTSFLTGREGEVMRTCEYAAAPFQMEIPRVSSLIVSARLNEFVENYRRIDQNFELDEWKGLSSLDLRKISLVQHIPIAQLLLECGDEVSIQGTISVGSDADNRLEAVFFEGQRNFIVVIRGTTEQQSKPCPKKTTNRKAVPLDVEHEHVEIYQCFLDEYQKIEQKCFALLDELTEKHPFCDVVFTGHSFGGALATLAAVRYANARPMMRVKCYPMASPKVGFSEFRRMVNSSPNLQVMRLEYGQDGKCQLPSQGGSHVGHTLVLHGSLGHNSHKTKEPVQAYKFDTPKYRKFHSIYPDLRSYVVALEEITRLHLRWPKDYVGTTGNGVVVNNEPRQVV